jgi:acyl-coenzyme A thioesterase PaaI-like protein
MSVIFPGESRFQGYANRLHGGVIALLFDAAMTHCLLARELAGVTAELKVRYQFPVAAGRAVIVRAWAEKKKSRLYLVQGTLHQDGEVKSTAQAKFWLGSMAVGSRPI